MALDPNKKFLYFNKDATSTEMDLALCFPVSSFIGIETQTSSRMDFFFEGAKGADATIVRIHHLQHAYIKNFMISLVDEINFGEIAFIRVYDHAERTTHPSDVSINMEIDIVPVFTLEDNDFVIADDVSIGGNLTFDSVALTNIQTSAESFVNDDISLMTSAAIEDKILSYGYSTTSGDITAVTITTDTGGGSAASDASGSADFSILGATGVGVTNSGTTITAVAVPGEIDHDSLQNFVANEHLRWDNDVSSTATIHANNITDLHGAGVDGSANQILTDDGDGTVTSEAGLTYDSEVLTIGDDDNGTATIKRKTHSDESGGMLQISGGDATGTDKGGGVTLITGGLGTGTGGGGFVRISTANADSSGSSANSLAWNWDFKNDGVFQTTTVGYGITEFINFHTNTFESVLSDGDQVAGKRLIYSPGANDVLADGQIFFLHTDGTWDQADASSTSTGASQLLCVGNSAARVSGVILDGFVRVPSTEILNTPGSGAVDGLPLYVSTTAGHFDFTAPSGNDEYVRVVGYAIDDDGGDVLVYFNPDSTHVKITA